MVLEYKELEGRPNPLGGNATNPSAMPPMECVGTNAISNLEGTVGSTDP